MSALNRDWSLRLLLEELRIKRRWRVKLLLREIELLMLLLIRVLLVGWRKMELIRMGLRSCGKEVHWRELLLSRW